MRVTLGLFGGSLGSLWAYDAHVYARGGAENRKSAPHSSEEHVFKEVKRHMVGPKMAKVLRTRARSMGLRLPSGRGRGEGKPSRLWACLEV